MKSVLAIVLSLLLIIISIQVYKLYKEQSELRDGFSATVFTNENLEKENSTLEADIEYYKDPRNLVKELKTKLNYKNPGEKFYIVIPE